MQLIGELNRLQHERGWLRDDDLRALAERLNVPLYRLQGLVSFYPHFRTAPPPRIELAVCRDVACWLAGGEAACARLKRELAGTAGLSNSAPEDLELREVSCLGRCDGAPACLINGMPARTADLAEVRRRIEQPHATDPEVDAAGLSRTAEHRTWKCDPYGEGCEPFAAVRELLRDLHARATRAIDTLKASGLRGMGGAGFPTGLKWEIVRNQPARPKYVICNADESEPGTFKDRVILDELPHLVLEGMALAGLIVGAERGIVFVRHEYEHARRIVDAEIARLRAAGLLGPDVLGSGRAFDVEVFVSPGGYILGEETALLQCLEDQRGEPRNKPPYPGTHGLWGKPTVINNVETLALVPGILLRGADWWKSQGRAPHEGLKVMAVSGHVARPGVYEIAMGTTVRELIDLAGGIAVPHAAAMSQQNENPRAASRGQPASSPSPTSDSSAAAARLLAFAPGGASSNWLPADKADVPIDFKTIQQAGSMLGSGALVVAAEGTHLLALATNVVRFFRNESCGKCVPCRVGTQKAVELLQRVHDGPERRESLAILSELGETLELTSICGLGQVALNPVLSVLRHFPALLTGA